MHHKLQVHFS